MVCESVATNLVAGDTNGRIATFLHELQDGTTRRAWPARTNVAFAVLN